MTWFICLGKRVRSSVPPAGITAIKVIITSTNRVGIKYKRQRTIYKIYEKDWYKIQVEANNLYVGLVYLEVDFLKRVHVKIHRYRCNHRMNRLQQSTAVPRLLLRNWVSAYYDTLARAVGIGFISRFLSLDITDTTRVYKLLVSQQSDKEFIKS